MDNSRGTIGGKTGKTAVLPGVCKIECGSDGTPPCYVGLIWLGRVSRIGGTPDYSTEPMCFQEERNEFEHPFYIKVTLTTLSVLSILSTFVINRRLFKFLRRPNKRFLDQIVHFQLSVTMILDVITFLYFNTFLWAKVPKHYVTELGCYIGTYIYTFMAPYLAIHSFFIALFRYICIIHPNRLSNLNISPEVFFSSNI